MNSRLPSVIILLGCLSALSASHLAVGADSTREDLAASELAWSIVPSPRRAGVRLYGVSALSPTQAWAVGDIYSPATPIIYRWNGAAWRQMSAGAVPDSSLRDVAGISANDAWAVGYQEVSDEEDLTVALHWDGARWTHVASPSPSDENYLSGVAALAGNDVWAVGHKGTSTLYGELIMHWDGGTWTVSPTRGNGYRVLTDVAAVAANDVWAIGYKFSFTSGYQGLAMHWDGVRWSDVALPRTSGGYTLLSGLAAISSSDIWAVGTSGGSPIKPLIAHWDGSAWSYVPNPPVPSDYAFLKGVTALASNDVWAAGYFTDASGTDQNLVEYWDGNAWTQGTVSQMPAAHNELWGVAPDRAGGLWSVGSFLPADFSDPLSSLVLRGSP
jgi:hypothetical protein